MLTFPAISLIPLPQAIVFLLNTSFHQLQSEMLFAALSHNGELSGPLHGLVRRQDGCGAAVLSCHLQSQPVAR